MVEAVLVSKHTWFRNWCYFLTHTSNFTYKWQTSKEWASNWDDYSKNRLNPFLREVVKESFLYFWKFNVHYYLQMTSYNWSSRDHSQVMENYSSDKEYLKQDLVLVLTHTSNLPKNDR